MATAAQAAVASRGGFISAHSLSFSTFLGAPLPLSFSNSLVLAASRNSFTGNSPLVQHARSQSTSRNITLSVLCDASTSASAIEEKIVQESAEERKNRLEASLDGASPYAIMDTALSEFGSEISIAFSGAEDVALIELAKLSGKPFRVFSLDTGRLHPETYRYFHTVEQHYGIRIEYFFPDSAAVEQLVRSKGLFSFLEDGHQECCGIRKVQPLERALSGLSAWVTGQRRDQSPGTRAALPAVQIDAVFRGSPSQDGTLFKFNPLRDMNSAQVWDFLRSHGAPTNVLHERGFWSIGCEPCTRPVMPNQHEREGRWWWEDATAKECGLHKAAPAAAEGASEGEGNGSSNSSSDRDSVRDLFQAPEVAQLNKDDMEELLASPRSSPSLVVLYAPWCPFCQAMEASFDAVAKSLHDSGSNVRVGKFRADLEHRAFASEKLQLKSFPTILFFPVGSSSVVKRESERRDEQSLLQWVQFFN